MSVGYICMFGDDNERLFGVDRRANMKGIGLTGLAAVLGGSSGGAVAAQSDGAGGGHGPLRNSRFLVEIDGVVTAGFNRVELPEAVIPEVQYREGNDASSARTLTAGGNNEFGSLLLEKGVDDSLELYEWFKQAQQGKMEEARRAMAVVLLDQRANHRARWEFESAWPARYDAPDLDAQSHEVAVEKFEILHEGMDRVS